jgi:putative CocE/NonD family hydrolase
MIAMRDRVRLHIAIYTPTEAPGALPIMFLRTPYGIDGYAFWFQNYLRELAADKYIFVFEDIRGRYRSEGQFVMARDPRHRKDATAIDESTDAYDTIDWLVKNVPNNNGRVGELGISYDGWTTVMSMLDPHPALKAVSPQASPVDQFLGDDFHHNGAFRLSYGFEYASSMETPKGQPRFRFDKYDTYDWYLALGPLSNVAKYLHGQIPTWEDFVRHPNYDEFWQRQTPLPYLDRVTVPTLNVAGWWDQEDFYGPITIYEALEKHDTDHKNFLVVGPWNHGGWGIDGDTSMLGAIDFGSHTAADFRKNIMAPFFAYYLKDQGPGKFPEVVTFEPGTNTWRHFDHWPPTTGITHERLYLQPGRGAAFEPPPPAAGDSGFDTYVSDPWNPVPYRHRPIPQGLGWRTWLVEDQRFVDHRPDVLTYETAPLDADVTLTGAITAHLFAATSGSDADWVVKLIDVYPDTMPTGQQASMGGFELMVANDVFRGRFRESFTTPHPITPNHVDEYRIDLHTQDYRFLKGHRIMVQVQSTWFPIIDRNPQQYVPNIFEAKESDFRVARQRVYRNGAHASYLDFPVETGTTAQ